MFKTAFRRSLTVALVAFFTAAILSADTADAQNRSNKGGEMRGKDRAEQVKEMNEEMKAGKDKAGKGKEMKAKKAKKMKDK